jgi:hypothetical protein
VFATLDELDNDVPMDLLCDGLLVDTAFQEIFPLASMI